MDNYKAENQEQEIDLVSLFFAVAHRYKQMAAAAVIPEKDSTVLVYCRSGNRSKQAADKLARLGYTNIVEFGGINSWPGEIVTE